MNPSPLHQNVGEIQVLEERSLTISQFASACNVSEHWIVQRVQGGVVHLDAETREQQNPPVGDVQSWRFSGHGIVRTRRIADLERIFDADPQLAAMTADLIEEVRQLRTLLNRRG